MRPAHRFVQQLAIRRTPRPRPSVRRLMLLWLPALLLLLLAACSGDGAAGDGAAGDEANNGNGGVIAANGAADGETDTAPDATEPAGASALPAAASPGGPEPGVFDDRIVFGQSAAFSGPASELGRDMRVGIDAAFAEINRNGGVHGRRLELTSLDDAYEPDAAIANTQQLIEQEQVFALIGAVGTPTSRSATPIAAAAGVPYIAPFTGAAFLRDPEWDNIINLRASYFQETEEMVERLTTDLGIERIAVMYQDDSFGRAGYNGVLAAMERRDMLLAGVGVYPRNTLAVKTALLELVRVQPEAVILVGAYQPVGEFIAWARHTELLDVVFMTISFVGSNALAEQLGRNGAGVFVTQVMPFPTDASRPEVAAYRRALSQHDLAARPGFVSLEGYLAGRLAVEGLERCGPEVTRACFLNALRSAEKFDIDGFAVDYSDGDNQGSDAVYLSVIGPDSRFRSIQTLRDFTR